MRIALVQFAIAQYAPEQNLKRAEAFIKEAKMKNADLVVFPEDFVVGPLFKHARDATFVDFDGKYRRHFSELAQKYRIDLVPGSWIEGTKQGWQNTSYYIGSTGKIKAAYHKTNLWHPERSYLAAGNQIATCHTRWGKVGLAICWDLAFPELFRRMMRNGVKIVICPSYWTKADGGSKGLRHNKECESLFVNSLCVARAFEHNIVLTYCNAAGAVDVCGRHINLIGQSQVTVPFKGAIGRLPANEEALLVVDIDTKILRDAESAYKLRKDVKTRIL